MHQMFICIVLLLCGLSCIKCLFVLVESAVFTSSSQNNISFVNKFFLNNYFVQLIFFTRLKFVFSVGRMKSTFTQISFKCKLISESLMVRLVLNICPCSKLVFQLIRKEQDILHFFIIICTINPQTTKPSTCLLRHHDLYKFDFIKLDFIF